MLGIGGLIDKGLANDLKASSFLDSKALEAYQDTKDQDTKDKIKDFKDIYEAFDTKEDKNIDIKTTDEQKDNKDKEIKVKIDKSGDLLNAISEFSFNLYAIINSLINQSNSFYELSDSSFSYRSKDLSVYGENEDINIKVNIKDLNPSQISLLLSLIESFSTFDNKSFKNIEDDIKNFPLKNGFIDIHIHLKKTVETFLENNPSSKSSFLKELSNILNNELSNNIKSISIIIRKLPLDKAYEGSIKDLDLYDISQTKSQPPTEINNKDIKLSQDYSNTKLSKDLSFDGRITTNQSHSENKDISSYKEEDLPKDSINILQTSELEDNKDLNNTIDNKPLIDKTENQTPPDINNKDIKPSQDYSNAKLPKDFHFDENIKDNQGAVSQTANFQDKAKDLSNEPTKEISPTLLDKTSSKQTNLETIDKNLAQNEVSKTSKEISFGAQISSKDAPVLDEKLKDLNKNDILFSKVNDQKDKNSNFQENADGKNSENFLDYNQNFVNNQNSLEDSFSKEFKTLFDQSYFVNQDKALENVQNSLRTYVIRLEDGSGIRIKLQSHTISIFVSYYHPDEIDNIDSSAELIKNLQSLGFVVENLVLNGVNLSEFQERGRKDSYEEKKRDNIMRDVKKYTEEDSNSSYSFNSVIV